MKIFIEIMTYLIQKQEMAKKKKPWNYIKKELILIMMKKLIVWI